MIRYFLIKYYKKMLILTSFRGKGRSYSSIFYSYCYGLLSQSYKYFFSHRRIARNMACKYEYLF